MQYEPLLQTLASRKQLEDQIQVAKNKFEESISTDKALLNELVELENRYRREAMLHMQENNIGVENCGEYAITRNTKYTNQIKDIGLLASGFLDNADKIKALGVDNVAELFAVETVVKDKKTVINVIDNFEKIENQLLPGCEKRATEFITITKQKK